MKVRTMGWFGWALLVGCAAPWASEEDAPAPVDDALTAEKDPVDVIVGAWADRVSDEVNAFAETLEVDEDGTGAWSFTWDHVESDSGIEWLGDVTWTPQGRIYSLLVACRSYVLWGSDGSVADEGCTVADDFAYSCGIDRDGARLTCTNQGHDPAIFGREP